MEGKGRIRHCSYSEQGLFEQWHSSLILTSTAPNEYLMVSARREFHYCNAIEGGKKDINTIVVYGSYCVDVLLLQTSVCHCT